MRYIALFIFLISAQLLFSQCYPDRHNTTWYDSWISCNPSPNPNSVRGESHWLHYDLGHLYELKKSQFWNANQPDFLEDGLQEIVIDYSIDGVNWEEWGTHTIGMANGSKYYEGEAGPDFENMIARYVLITAVSNYGGSCYSLAELKIDAAESTVNTEDVFENRIAVFPNPASNNLNIRFAKTPATNPKVKIIDVLGKTLFYSTLNSERSLDVSSLEDGIYILEVIIENKSYVSRFIKQK